MIEPKWISNIVTCKVEFELYSQRTLIIKITRHSHSYLARPLISSWHLYFVSANWLVTLSHNCSCNKSRVLSNNITLKLEYILLNRKKTLQRGINAKRTISTNKIKIARAQLVLKISTCQKIKAKA